MRALRLATRSYRTLQLPFHSPKCFLNKQLVHRAYFHSDDSFTASNRIKGEVLDYAVDLRNSRPGDIINIPYEITISEATQGFWNAAFHSQNRINTSRPFARSIGLQDRILPFSLVLFLTSSMTHADAAKVQVGFENAIYNWPAFVGDTFTKSFQVKSIRNTSDGNHTLVEFKCKLINQRKKVCMTADKRMLFDFSVPVPRRGHDVVPTYEESKEDNEKNQLFLNHLLSKAEQLRNIGSQSLSTLRQGQLIYHQMNRSLTFPQSQQLATLARLTHPRHFDTRRYDEKTEILIPGGLVLGIAMSTSSRDLHEILHEELLSCSYINSLHPGDVVSAMSYIKTVDENEPWDLENIVVRTIAVKNFDLVRELEDGLPTELFTGDAKFTRDIERICKEKCPQLSNKVILQCDRRILRQSSRSDVFLL